MIIAILLLYVLPALITIGGTAKWVIEDDTKGLAIFVIGLIPFANLFFAIIVLGCIMAKYTEPK